MASRKMKSGGSGMLKAAKKASNTAKHPRSSKAGAVAARATESKGSPMQWPYKKPPFEGEGNLKGC